MKTPSELYLQLFKFSPYPLADAVAKNDELSVFGLTAYVGETEKIESLRFTFALVFAIPGRKPTELDQPRFILIQFQVEFQQSFPKINLEPFSVPTVLKADHKVIAVPDDDNVTTGKLVSPLVRPQIKHIMKIYIGQQGADDAPYAKGNFEFERIIRYVRQKKV